jgi:predicted nucleic acid-binding protein
MNFVVDASVALAWCFQDEGGDHAVAVLERLRSSEAVAAAHWPLEVANGLLMAERRKRLSLADCRRIVRLLLSLPIVIEPMNRTRTFDSTHMVARKHGLTSYDAAYLELALRLGIPMATLDSDLAKAARAEGVGVVGSA